MNKEKAMVDKVRMEKILKLINPEEAREVIIAEKYAGCIVAVANGKMASVPFTDDISEAKQNFETLEREIGKENMRGARISYISKPDETLML